MEQAPKMLEEILYKVWQKKEFTQDMFTVAGEPLNILDPGIHNTDNSGPDFRNARVRINNLVFVGDIEIDRNVADWKNHKHYIDKNYNRVILHVTLNNPGNESFVKNRDGRNIPILCLSNYIHQDIVRVVNSKYAPTSSFVKKNYCMYVNSRLAENFKIDYLYKLGLERFKKRCDKIYFRLKELVFLKEMKMKEPQIRYDLNTAFISKEFSYQDFEDKEIWQQLLYELIFEALGYSNNIKPMVKLAQYVNINFINSITDSTKAIENIRACLFNVAGLLPEITSKEMDNPYVVSIRKIWSTLKVKYGTNYLQKEDWQFYKIRPINFPTVRIAGGAVILYRIIFGDFIGNTIKLIEAINDNETILKTLKKNFIIKADGYWKNHFSFEGPGTVDIKILVGNSRTDEIIINTVLPFISVYSEVFGFREISKKILSVYTSYMQTDGNRIIDYISRTLSVNKIWKKSIYAQGMIELYRYYCTRNKC